jgi:molybdopterin-guanine dinucleotide biosynthesis protein MobB
MVAVIGKKHSGKTTSPFGSAPSSIAAVIAVMTIKHGSHTFNIDPATTDTYRHYHEGIAERVAMAAPGQVRAHRAVEATSSGPRRSRRGT